MTQRVRSRLSDKPYSQTVPNSLCQFSYALHTETDKDLWKAQSVSVTQDTSTQRASY